MSTGEMMAYCECGRLLGKCADCLRKRCDALEDKCRDLTQNFDGAVETVYKLRSRVDDLEAEVSDYELHQWRDRAKEAESRIMGACRLLDRLTSVAKVGDTLTPEFALVLMDIRSYLVGKIKSDEKR